MEKFVDFPKRLEAFLTTEVDVFGIDLQFDAGGTLHRGRLPALGICTGALHI